MNYLILLLLQGSAASDFTALAVQLGQTGDRTETPPLGAEAGAGTAPTIQLDWRDVPKVVYQSAQLLYLRVGLRFSARIGPSRAKPRGISDHEKHNF